MAHSANDAAPARSWQLVVPSNSVNLPAGCRSIFVGGAGDVVLVGQDDVAVTFTGVIAGTILPCGAKRVNSTDTTATLMVALY